MPTEVLRVDAAAPEPAAIARAADVLRRGGLVVFPTETVYGLGAAAFNVKAVGLIFEAKGRPAHNPLIVHVPSSADAREVVAQWPDSARRLAERFWPGSLTLVLPKASAVPGAVTAGGPNVAVRVPAHLVALALLEATGLPVAAPSANRSNRLSPTRPGHVLRDLEGRIDLLLDAGPTVGGLESTVLDLTASPPRLLRPGLVTPAAIEAVIGPIARPSGAPAASESIGQVGPLPSPGLLARHYAPRAPLELVDGDGRPRVEALCRSGLRVGWLAFDEPTGADDERLVRILMPREAAAYGAELFAALHGLDDCGVDRIVVAAPPAGEAWMAVHDRLRRASWGP